MRVVAPYLTVAVVLSGAAPWSPSVCSAAKDFCRSYASVLAMVANGVIARIVFLNVPILFEGALRFDGSRNHGSFTFVSSARSMRTHAFYGAPDFDPRHPVHTIIFWMPVLGLSGTTRVCWCLSMLFLSSAVLSLVDLVRAMKDSSWLLA
jgi:hypothetical protein